MIEWLADASSDGSSGNSNLLSERAFFLFLTPPDSLELSANASLIINRERAIFELTSNCFYAPKHGAKSIETIDPETSS